MTDLKDLTLRFLHEAMGNGRKDVLEALLHPEYVPQEFSVKKWEEMALNIERETTTQSSLIDVIRAFHDKMQGLVFDVTDIIQEGNKVAVFWTVKGSGYNPDSIGGHLNIDWSTDGSHLITFRDGKIYRLRYIADSLSAFIQGRLAFIHEDQSQLVTYVSALKNLGIGD